MYRITEIAAENPAKFQKILIHEHVMKLYSNMESNNKITFFFFAFLKGKCEHEFINYL